jgi:3-hydroxymyristoyl/3-hydroxydecanoyl-(acyl carrier protein) dehydratase
MKYLLILKVNVRIMQLIDCSFRPNIEDKKQLQSDLFEIWLNIPQNLYYLNGHFPDMAIVPGVVLLHWVVQFTQEIFKPEGFVCLIKTIKFTNIVRPKDVLVLRLERIIDQTETIINFSYSSDKITYSSGSLRYNKG